MYQPFYVNGKIYTNIDFRYRTKIDFFSTIGRLFLSKQVSINGAANSITTFDAVVDDFLNVLENVEFHLRPTKEETEEARSNWKSIVDPLFKMDFTNYKGQVTWQPNRLRDAIKGFHSCLTTALMTH